MYTPRHFAEHDQAEILRFIAARFCWNRAKHSRSPVGVNGNLI